jgi:hypothetical protein
MFTIADQINYSFNIWINKHPEATEEQMRKAFNRIKNKLYKEYGVTGQSV